jgi:hypothetical protein
MAPSSFPELAELLAVLERSTSVADLRWVGAYLAPLVGRRAYSPNYLLGCLNGNRGMQPGKPLRTAVLAALAIAAEGVHPAQAVVLSTHQDRSVLAPDGIEVSGAQVGVSARMCIVPGCPVSFIPNTPRRRKCYYHSPPRIKHEAGNA